MAMSVAAQKRNAVLSKEMLLPYERRERDPFLPGVAFYPLMGSKVARSGLQKVRLKRSALRLNIPPTACYGVASDTGDDDVEPIDSAFVYTDTDGSVVRELRFSDRDVVDAFRSDDPDEIVAILKKAGSNGNEVVLLTTDELRATLRERGSYGPIAVQKFVRPRRGRAFMARTVWRKKDPSKSQRAAEEQLCYFATCSQSYAQIGSEALHTNVAEASSVSITMVKDPRATAEVAALNAAIKHFMENSLNVTVSELVVDYTRDEHGVWWLLQVKRFGIKRRRAAAVSKGVRSQKAQEADYDAAIRAAEESDGDSSPVKGSRKMGRVSALPKWESPLLFDPPELEKEARTICHSCLQRLPVHKLPATLSRKMIRETQIHLLKRGISFSWFERAETVSLLRVGGERANKYEQLRVCQVCFDMYQVEKRLVHAEQVFARAVGLPMLPIPPLMRPNGEPWGLKTPPLLPTPNFFNDAAIIAAEEGIETALPDNINCYRVQFFLHTLENLSIVPLLQLKRSGAKLALQFTAFGTTTHVPVELDSAALIRQERRPWSAAPEVQPVEAVAESESESESEAASSVGDGEEIDPEQALLDEESAREQYEKEQAEMEAAENEAPEKEAAEKASARGLSLAGHMARETRLAAEQAVEAERLSEEAAEIDRLYEARRNAGWGDEEEARRHKRSLFGRKPVMSEDEIQQEKQIERQMRAKLGGEDDQLSSDDGSSPGSSGSSPVRPSGVPLLPVAAEPEPDDDWETRPPRSPRYRQADLPVNVLRTSFVFGTKEAIRDLLMEMGNLEIGMLSVHGAHTPNFSEDEPGGTVVGKMEVPIKQLARASPSDRERRDFWCHVHSTEPPEAYDFGPAQMKVSIGMTRIAASSPEHEELIRFGGVYLSNDVSYTIAAPMPESWLANCIPTLEESDTPLRHPTAAQRELFKHVQETLALGREDTTRRLAFLDKLRGRLVRTLAKQDFGTARRLANEGLNFPEPHPDDMMEPVKEDIFLKPRIFFREAIVLADEIEDAVRIEAERLAELKRLEDERLAEIERQRRIREMNDFVRKAEEEFDLLKQHEREAQLKQEQALMRSMGMKISAAKLQQTIEDDEAAKVAAAAALEKIRLEKEAEPDESEYAPRRPTSAGAQRVSDGSGSAEVVSATPEREPSERAPSIVSESSGGLAAARDDAKEIMNLAAGRRPVLLGSAKRARKGSAGSSCRSNPEEDQDESASQIRAYKPTRSLGMAAPIDDVRHEYWRVVVEMLRVDGLQHRPRTAFRRSQGLPDNQLTVDTRLFGAALCSDPVRATPPITVVDSYHKVFIRASEKQMRRYFFSAPRLAFSISLIDPSLKTPAVAKQVLDFNKLLARGFVEESLQFVVRHDELPDQRCTLSVALWLERVEANVDAMDLTLSKDLGFGVRRIDIPPTVHVEDEPLEEPLEEPEEPAQEDNEWGSISVYN